MTSTITVPKKGPPPIKVQRLHERAVVPKTWSEQAIGFDLHACLFDAVGRRNNAILPPRTTRLIPTGLVVEPPPGHYLMVLSRSGLAKDRSVFVANAPGLIDPDFRGELMVLLYNGGHETYYVLDGDRVGQLVCFPIMTVEFVEGEFTPTERGNKGFGSTGR